MGDGPIETRPHRFSGGTNEAARHPALRERAMPRSIVQRSVPDGRNIPVTEEGAHACPGVVDRNTVDGVIRVHSYVSTDTSATFCVDDGPSSDALRSAAERTGLPVDSITRVPVRDLYVYR
jgi:hypothetical protein